MSLYFREININDVESLGNLFEINNRKEITDFFYAFPMSYKTAYEILTKAKKDKFFVAILDDQFIGFSMLRGFDEGFNIPSFGIFIDFLHQNRRYGCKFIIWVLNWADCNKIKSIRLSVNIDNKIALNLYQSLGFIKTNEYKDKFNHLHLVMHRHLNNIL